MKKIHINYGVITLAIIAATAGTMSTIFHSSGVNSLAIISTVTSAASTVISVHNSNNIDD